MTNSISFVTPGLIDIRAVTTLGVNVKEGDSPIGYFGTGLKYAITVLLREAQSITLNVGFERYEFSARETEIRGKSFFIIHMNGHPLSFTTELGKNWTLRNAFREFYSNTQDENGIITPGAAELREGWTVITVEGEGFAAAAAARDEYILSETRRPILQLPAIEVYPGTSEQVFYRGIAAYQLPKVSLYTYNILESSTLTEDRTLESTFSTYWNISEAIQGLPPEYLSAALVAEDFFEQSHDLSYHTAPESFFAVVNLLARQKPASLNKSAYAKFLKEHPLSAPDYEEFQPTSDQQEEISAAITSLEAAGFEISRFPICFAKSLGERTLAVARNGTIWISEQALRSDKLLRALLEEYLHLSSSYGDCCRELQNLLFEHLLRLVEERPKTNSKDPS
jgi:hypothetical protein